MKDNKMSYPEEIDRVREWFDELGDLDGLMAKANQFMNYESSTLSLRRHKFPRSHNKDVNAGSELDTFGWFDGSVQTMACELTRELEYDYDKVPEEEKLGDYKWKPIELKHLPEELAPSSGTHYTGYLQTEFVFSSPQRMIIPDSARLTRLDGVWALPHSLQATPVLSGKWTKDYHDIPKSIHEYDVFKDELKGIMSDAARGYFEEPKSKYEHMLRNAKEYFEPWQYSGGEYFDREKCFNLMRDWLALYEDSHVRARGSIKPYASLINRADVDRLHEMLNWLTPGGEDRRGKVREREPWTVSPGDCRCHPWVKQLRSVWLVEDWENWGDEGHIQNELTGWKLVASNNHFEVDVDTKYHELVNSLTKDTTGDNFLYNER